MVAEGRGVGEPLVTDATPVRLLTRVGPRMDPQGTGPVKLHSAHVAAEWWILAVVGADVDPQMLLEASRGRERVPADEASIRLDPRVPCPHMDAQIIGF